MISSATLSLAQDSVRPDPIQLGTGEWYPYTSASAPGKGVVAEVVSETLARMGLAADFRFVGFEVALSLGAPDAIETEPGAPLAGIDAIFPFYRTPEREERFSYSEPLTTVTTVLFFNPKKEATRSFGERQHIGENSELRAAFVRGYRYAPLFERAFPEERRTLFDDEEAAFRALADPRDERVHLVPAALRVGYSFIERLSDKERARVIANPYLQARRTVHLLVPRKAPGAAAWIDRFDRALGALREDGTIAAIEGRQRFGPRAQIVVLTNPGSVPLIFARLQRDAEEVVVIPRGTRARIEAWGRAFVQPTRTTLYDQLYQRTEVTILDGPLAGRRVFIDNIFIEMSGD